MKLTSICSIFLILCCSLSACVTEKVLDLSKKSAETRLQKKQLIFLMDAPVSRMGEIARIDPSAPFYAALLLEDLLPGDEKVTSLLEIACKSPITHAEAAKKLIQKDPDHYFALNAQNPGLAAGTSWEPAFSIIADLTVRPQKSVAKLRAEILDFFLGEKINEAHRWAFAKLLKNIEPVEQNIDRLVPFIEDFPTNVISAGERAAISGRFAVSRLSYAEAIRDFKKALAEQENILLQYRELVGDLGRAYQYSAAANEGAVLFAKWESDLLDGKKKLPASFDSVNDLRYLLLYYSGRIKRQIHSYDEAAAFFDRAIAIAPDEIQEDACIWYIIDMAWTASAAKAVAALQKYAPLWHDPAYFADIFEKISLYYTTRKRWDGLLQFFPAVRHYADGESLAKYGYLIGRTLYFGYITPEKAAIALQIPGSTAPPDVASISPETFYKIAYNSDDYRGQALPPFYYHSLAAEHLFRRSDFRLPEKIVDLSEQKEAPENKTAGPPPAENTLFLSNFFRFGCADKIYSYLRTTMDTLPVEELRDYAEKLTEAGRFGDSIRIAYAYMRRRDYILDRRDLEICYPAAFKDVVERVSRQTGMDESLLFGLIHTESIFIPDIASHAGALGLTQLMPATGTEMARTLIRSGGPDFFVNDRLDFFDPRTNVYLGASYYMQLFDRTGSRLIALLSYNGGIGRVRRWRNTKTDLSEDLFLETIELTETREYGKKVLAAAAVYDFLYY